MWEYRAGGLSLRTIAGALNVQLAPTKQNGLWQANTVREILVRLSETSTFKELDYRRRSPGFAGGRQYADALQQRTRNIHDLVDPTALIADFYRKGIRLLTSSFTTLISIDGISI